MATPNEILEQVFPSRKRSEAPKGIRITVYLRADVMEELKAANLEINSHTVAAALLLVARMT